MAIIIACYKIVDGMALLPTVKILEKHKDTHDFGFDINDNLKWFKYLKKKYTKLVEDPQGIPRAFKVYTFGGYTPLCLFPGVDKDGKTKNLAKYGRLVNLPEHKGYLEKC